MVLITPLQEMTLIIDIRLYSCVSQLSFNGTMLIAFSHLAILIDITQIQRSNKSMNAQKLQERLRNHYYDLFPTNEAQSSNEGTFCVFHNILASFNSIQGFYSYRMPDTPAAKSLICHLAETRTNLS